MKEMTTKAVQTHRENPKMRETIAKAIQIFRAYPEMGDHEIFMYLIKRGIDRNVAARLVEFIPCAYVRILFPDSGAVFNDLYRRLDKKGKISVEHPLTAEPLWNEVVAYARSELQEGIPQQIIHIIASHSAEYKYASPLLKNGGKLNGFRTSSLLFPWPENGPEDDEMEAEQNTKNSDKKW